MELMCVLQPKTTCFVGKGALTKNFCQAWQILAINEVGEGGGLSESVKKGKFVTKIFFSYVCWFKNY